MGTSAISTITSAVTGIMGVCSTFLTYIFDGSHEAIAACAFLPVIGGAVAVVTRFAKHKHK